MMNPKTHDIVLSASNHKYLCFWISAPYKGGSKWNQYNWSARPELREHISALVNEFVEFLGHVVRILRAVIAKGVNPIICLELPALCAYWNMTQMQDFLSEFCLDTVVFHGCAYGLVAKSAKHRGMPIKKPWKVACNHPLLIQMLRRTCTCESKHAPCAGSETSATENYTTDLAEQVHKVLDYIRSNELWSHRVGSSGQRSSPEVTSAAPSAPAVLMAPKTYAEPDAKRSRPAASAAGLRGGAAA